MSLQPARGHRANLRKGRVSLPGHAYFITKCALSPTTVALRHADCADLVHSSLRWAREQQWWYILGFVIMPNHYHVIVGLNEFRDLSDIIKSISKFTARRINALLHQTESFWEESFYDHAIRDHEDYDIILQYVHQNPVEAGYVDTAEEWLYSTANPRFSDEIDWDWISVSMKTIPNARRFRKEDISYRFW